MLKLGFRICTFYVLEYEKAGHSFLSVGFLHSELDLLYLTFPAYHSLISRPGVCFCSRLLSVAFGIVSCGFFSTAGICCRFAA